MEPNVNVGFTLEMIFNFFDNFLNINADKPLRKQQTIVESHQKCYNNIETYLIGFLLKFTNQITYKIYPKYDISTK